MKGIDELHEKYVSQGLVAVSVVVQNKAGGPAQPSDATVWSEGLNLNLPVWVDTTGEFFSTYDPDGVLPVAYIIDRKGVVAWVKPGTSPTKVAELEETVKRLLAE